MTKILQSFGGSIVITALVVTGAGLLGGLSAAYIVALVGILEVSLSFDNAVVNAKVLGDMDPVWQRRFVLFGIPVAVIGMRLLFPIVIVSATSDMSFLQVYKLAISDPDTYRIALEGGLHNIYAFAGAFLLMIGLGWFFGEARETYWIALIENNLISRTLHRVASIEIIIALALIMVINWFVHDIGIVMSYLSGVLLNMLVGTLDDLFTTEEEGEEFAKKVRAGIVGFIYLEILDASFSFDGVLGAFAMSTNIFVIAAGLGIGALFVRSLTIYMVRNGTLEDYIYLENGAHYAILSLALLILAKIGFEVSEIITGSVGAFFIIAAFISSLIAKRKATRVEAVA